MTDDTDPLTPGSLAAYLSTASASARLILPSVVLRIFGLEKPLTHGRQNPGSKIRATDFGLGKPGQNVGLRIL